MSEELLTGRILLVEDDASAATILSQVLSSVGNDVEIADDGRQALSKVGDFNPDVILLDLQMPGRDGFELARLIRVNPRQSLIPIIMMSGLNDREVRLRAIHCGADDFIAKPLTTEDLFTRIGNALRLLKLRREMAELKRNHSSVTGSSVGSVEGLRSCIDSASAALRRSLLNWVDEVDELGANEEVSRGAPIESVVDDVRASQEEPKQEPASFERGTAPASAADMPEIGRESSPLPN